MPAFDRTLNARLPIARRFASTQAITDIQPLGNGLINDTFLVMTDAEPFVLQRINTAVFPRPARIMENLQALNKHLQRKPAGSVKLRIPDILPAVGGEYYYEQNGDYWRALRYINHTESLEVIGSTHDAAQAGFALGHFHRLLSDLDPGILHDTLPDFHITPNYLSRYDQVAANLPVSSADSRYCADFIDRHRHIAGDLETAKQQGLLTPRVIHGDPKLNNFLFDRHTGTIVGVVDLDTVKPGLVHYDIGDCLRSCCQTTAPVGFDTDRCAVILASYLAEAGVFFSESDYAYLYPAIRLIPFELGIRFLTDHLEGDRYFKVTEPGQNLRRAAEQFQLCEAIGRQEPAIRQIIARLKKQTLESCR
ncbi:MAG: aminoglycoside phosphotransferase family protein [Methylobacter sp.]|uniref:phosphotransferase enzyme family protein n=1 Tax=Methylobacter sp. TaxID=2051955 RepID=UPI002583BE12|nr:aminoglycoside phosphotransferase family protein [Methylobacter sp.]MCL7423036.1 aminoglycoside phosphotransferase family protein [Methylobacter sp.]